MGFRSQRGDDVGQAPAEAPLQEPIRTLELLDVSEGLVASLGDYFPAV